MMTAAPGRKGNARLQQKREKTARELLEAARSVLSAKGYHAAKIADIARTAGVGVGTFYLYYPTKKAIFLELVQETVRRLKEELDAVRARVGDAGERSRAATETFFRFAQENRELFRIVFGHGASFHEVVRESQELFVADIKENLLAGMQSGAFRAANADVWAEAFIGMSIQVVAWWIEQEGVPIEEVTRAVTDLALHGIAADAAGK
jgi:AcrR family transcriptional regulator